MFETTLEAQALDESQRRLGTLSAAALAHLGIGLAIVAAAALIVPPVPPPELHEGLVIVLPPTIPVGEASPRTALPPPRKGSEHPAASKALALPRVESVEQPGVTPDRLPDAPPSGADAVDDAGRGARGDPNGDDHGVPGGVGTDPAGGGTDPDGSSPQALTGDMERPVLLTKVEPEYPNAARIARMTGRVTVEAVVGLDGHVESAEVISSTSRLFDEAALDAVRRWTYRPASMNGRPVRVYFKVAVEFVLR